jgi:hypothetical protein
MISIRKRNILCYNEFTDVLAAVCGNLVLASQSIFLSRLHAESSLLWSRKRTFDAL